MTNAPTVGLKARAAHGDHFAYSPAVRQLFALDAEPVNDD